MFKYPRIECILFSVNWSYVNSIMYYFSHFIYFNSSRIITFSIGSSLRNRRHEKIYGKTHSSRHKTVHWGHNLFCLNCGTIKAGRYKNWYFESAQYQQGWCQHYFSFVCFSFSLFLFVIFSHILSSRIRN